MQKIWLETKYKCLTCCCLWFMALLWVPSWRVLLAGSLTHFLPLQEPQPLALPLTLLFFLEQFRVMTFAPFWHAHIDQCVMFMACGAEPALLVYSGLCRTNCLLNECLWLHEPVTWFMSCTPLLLEWAVPLFFFSPPTMCPCLENMLIQNIFFFLFITSSWQSKKKKTITQKAIYESRHLSMSKIEVVFRNWAVTFFMDLFDKTPLGSPSIAAVWNFLGSWDCSLHFPWKRFSHQLVTQSTQHQSEGWSPESAVGTKLDRDKVALFFCRAASRGSWQKWSGTGVHFGTFYRTLCILVFWPLALLLY